MILSIESSLPTFKSVRFKSGLNVLLADSEPDSTAKQTRNSAGKTSLIEIIHFIFGADCDKESLFRTPHLIEYSFTGTFSLGAIRMVVERSGKDHSKVFILEGAENEAALPVREDKESGRIYISNTNWRAFLGHKMFGLPADVRGTIYDESYTPTFRALFSYFARKKNSGGFINPERSAEKQQRWDWQVNLSYLFGLDWNLPFLFHKIRVRERTLEELKRASKGGALGDVVGTVAQLRPQLTVSEDRARKLRSELDNFEVLESYRDLSRRAAVVKSEMQAVSRDTISLNETIIHLERSVVDEHPPEYADIERLYEAAGIELPGIALRRFEEVSQFYKSVVQNRRTHLDQEIRDARSQAAACEQRLAVLDKERSEILKTLQGRGALDDFLRLQRMLAEAEVAAASIRERFKTAELLEGEGTQLEIDRANLKRRLQEDYQERRTALDEIILVVAEAIADLYEDRFGRFVIEATDNGPEFKISIEGDRGGGIANMEIFCFDLALLLLVSKRLGGPGFLIHDSHLFDGVDERQIAKALSLGARATTGNNLQYIVTMNSDIFDRLPLSDEVDREAIVVKTRLSDLTEIGGLFGFWFE